MEAYSKRQKYLLKGDGNIKMWDMLCVEEFMQREKVSMSRVHAKMRIPFTLLDPQTSDTNMWRRPLEGLQVAELKINAGPTSWNTPCDCNFGWLAFPFTRK